MAKSMEDEFRARIARIARRQVGQNACSRTTEGKKGFFTSCHGGFKEPEFWCSDFARWVWWKAGAINTAPGTNVLTAAAVTFVNYGRLRNKPRVGDAVLFGYNHDPKKPTAAHVGIVVKVNTNGTIVSVSGDIGGEDGTAEHFAATSRVTLDNAYNGKVGTSDPRAPNSPVSGYVSPVEDDMPYTKKQILKIVQDGVSAELNTKLGASGITPAQGAKAAVHAQQALAGLAQQVADLTAYVKQHLPPPAPPAVPASVGGTTSTSSSDTASAASSGTGPASGDGTGAAASSGTGPAAGSGTASASGDGSGPASSSGTQRRRTGAKARTSPVA